MSPLLGISLKLISALCFTLMAAGAKFVSSRYPVGEIIFCRSFFAMLPLLIWLGFRGDLATALRTSKIRSHLKRGVIGSCGMFSGFQALAMLPLPDAVALSYATPLIVVVLAAVLLKEKVRLYRWSAVIFGFCGVLVMLSPHLMLFLAGSTTAIASASPGPSMMSGSSLGVAIALVAAVFSALATIEVRVMTRYENTGAIVFYFMALTTLLGLLTAFLGWNMPDMQDALWLIGIGIVGGLGQIFLTESYRHGDASLIAPFEYTTMIYAVMLGWLMFGEWPANAVFIGAMIVILSGIFVIWREHKLGLLRPEVHSAGPQRVT